MHKPSKPTLSSSHEAKKPASKIQSHSADLDITTSDPSKCYGKSNVPGEDKEVVYLLPVVDLTVTVYNVRIMENHMLMIV